MKEYRKLKRGDENICTLGLGMGGIQNAPPEEIEKVVRNAAENGINFFDLSLAGDKMAHDHCRKLKVNADACISCGHCNRRCPFKVKQQERMNKISKYFIGE